MFNSALLASEQTITAFKVNGIQGELLKNVEFYLEKIKHETVTVQLKRYSEKQIRSSLKALGYYQPEIKIKFTVIGQETNTAFLMDVNIEKGPATLINALTFNIIGAGKTDNEFMTVLNTLPLKLGDVVNHAHYTKSKTLIDDRLLELGYFDAKWDKSQLGISLVDSSAKVELLVNTGERYVYAPIVIKGDTQAEKYIRTLAPFKTGQVYRAGDISKFNFDLAATPYFKSVRVYADIENRENAQIPIKIEVLHKALNNFEIGGGFSTDLGAKARFKWSRPWVGSNGHYFENNVIASEVEQEFKLSYTIPENDPINDVWRLSLGYKNEENRDTEKFTHKVTSQLQRQWLLENRWVRTSFIRHEKESFELADKVEHTEMLIPGISYAKKRIRGGTTPYWGDHWLITLELAQENFFSNTDLLKFQLESAILRTYYTRHMIYARATLGAIWVDDINKVPGSLRFYAGGDQSVRGFGYESISPTENEVKVGGRYLATGTLEYNYQFAANWRLALFTDAGTATNDFSEQIEVGTGFGIRWLTPIGPVRVDHAWALTTDNKTTRISIMIGPEI